MRTRKKRIINAVIVLILTVTFVTGNAYAWSMETDLSNVDASFWGEGVNKQVGYSVSIAGDVNGDGYDDILIGARYHYYGGYNGGKVYLILGKSSGWTRDIDLSNADASFLGEDGADWAGYSVSGAGDVNGDGYDDILISAYGNEDWSDNADQVYLIFGKSSGWTRDTRLSNADASFLGDGAYSHAGHSISGAGDVNGDGYDDILIGAYMNSDGHSLAGQVYLIFGKSSGWTMDTKLSNVNASFFGEDSGDYAGWSVSGAGDVNGDGFDDILIGACGDEEGGYYAGQVYLILGKSSGWTRDIDLSNADASFLGEDVFSWAGGSISGAGDVNDDGFDDILICASQVYLIFGKSVGWTMDANLSNADASFRTGGSVSGVGDVNGDGYDDILIGASGNDDGGYYAGQVYLIFGKNTGWTMYTDLSNADASFWGENEGDGAGGSISGAGDVNGDGYDDILIGAPGNDDGGNSVGQVYMVLGKSTDWTGWTMDTDLSNVNASFWDEDEDDRVGYCVSSAGDVNGDGYDDVLIGACDDEDNGDNADQVYLIFGESTGWTMDTKLSNADVSFLGDDADDRAGYSVSGAGDVNGDGFDDILIGACMNDDGGENAGQVFLIFGKSTGWTMDTKLLNADVSFLGEDTGDAAGRSVSGAGDVNGDGYDDILIGAPGNDDGGNSAGQMYLIFGKSTNWTMDIKLSNANASFWGEDTDDRAGQSVSSAGDVNGDGYDDILIGALYNDNGGYNAGQVYMIFGKNTSWTMDTKLSNADASFLGEDSNDWAGRSVSGVGDVNGDGFDDILIGTSCNDDGGNNAGQVYMIFGKNTGWIMDTNLSNADASFWGEDANDRAGSSVSGAGDINGDGFNDMVIGAYSNDENGRGAGQVYMIFGKNTGWTMDADLSNVDATFWGEDVGDRAGGSVSGAGDINGDGFHDILIGASCNDHGGDNAGQVYLILGNCACSISDIDLKR